MKYDSPELTEYGTVESVTEQSNKEGSQTDQYSENTPLVGSIQPAVVLHAPGTSFPGSRVRVCLVGRCANVVDDHLNDRRKRVVILGSFQDSELTGFCDL